MLNLTELTKNGASEKQLEVVQNIYNRLIKSKYTDVKVWCRQGVCRLYLDAGYIHVNSIGIPFVLSSHEFFRRKIQEIIRAEEIIA